MCVCQLISVFNMTGLRFMESWLDHKSFILISELTMFVGKWAGRNVLLGAGGSGSWECAFRVSLLLVISPVLCFLATMNPAALSHHKVPASHQTLSSGTNWPCTRSSETVSCNKPFPPLNCACKMFCPGNRNGEQHSMYSIWHIISCMWGSFFLLLFLDKSGKTLLHSFKKLACDPSSLIDGVWVRAGVWALWFCVLCLSFFQCLLTSILGPSPGWFVCTFCVKGCQIYLLSKRQGH